jgi:hypothetical protein
MFFQKGLDTGQSEGELICPSGRERTAWGAKSLLGITADYGDSAFNSVHGESAPRPLRYDVRRVN